MENVQLSLPETLPADTHRTTVLSDTTNYRTSPNPAERYRIAQKLWKSGAGIGDLSARVQMLSLLADTMDLELAS